MNELELSANLIKVAGYIYLCFHGFGGGSPRGQELYRTARHDVIMSGGMLFYETISKKPKSKYIKTQRCLPPCISRLVMISFAMYSGGDDGQLFNLNFDQVDEAVASTYGDVFGLTHRLSFQKSRQLFASIGNTMKKMYPDQNFDAPGMVSVIVLFVDHNFSILLNMLQLTTKSTSIKFNSLCNNAQEVADAAEAEQMSHSRETHLENYSTFDLSERDEIFRRWWRHLGGANFDNPAPVTGEILPITQAQMQASLEYLLEIPGAQFREGQLESCSHVANSTAESALIGLDCGAGKSATFTLPLYARHMYQKITGVTIVICPHRLAMRQQYEKSLHMFRSTSITVGIFSGNDIDDEFTAKSAGKFNLIFMTIDAWSRIV